MNFDQDIEGSLNTLHKGGLILYPTDTVWGIGCDATNPVAVNKIFNLKKKFAKPKSCTYICNRIAAQVKI